MSIFNQIGSWFNNKADKVRSWLGDVGDRARSLWKDFTGVTAVDKQNEANLNLAKYQTQVQEEMYNKYSSPEALMRQYQEAGLNPNLVYGSASAGQGNVPSFSAPHVERNISGADKVNKALSLLSAISGAAQSVYQASAAREAAQQAGVKTMNDIVSYKKNALGYVFDSDLFGASVGNPNVSLFRNRNNGINFVHGDLYSSYLGAAREAKFNEFARSVFTNYYDYGKMYDKSGNILNADFLKDGLLPYYHTRNRQAQLKYNLMDELGNMGTYGKLAVSLLGTLF